MLKKDFNLNKSEKLTSLIEKEELSNALTTEIKYYLHLYEILFKN